MCALKTVFRRRLFVIELVIDAGIYADILYGSGAVKKVDS